MNTLTMAQVHKEMADAAHEEHDPPVLVTPIVVNRLVFLDWVTSLERLLATPTRDDGGD